MLPFYEKNEYKQSNTENPDGTHFFTPLKFNKSHYNSFGAKARLNGTRKD